MVCGGAVQRYHGCKWESGEEGRGYRRCHGKRIPPQENKLIVQNSNDLSGAVHCVETVAGGQWCSGPKTDSCLVFDKEDTKHW